MSTWVKLLKTDIDDFNSKIKHIKEAERTMFKAADLSGLDLSEAILYRCDLSQAKLSNSTVDGYQLSCCRLEAANLDNIRLTDEHWRPMLEQIQLLWIGATAWSDFRAKHQPALLNGVYFSANEFDGFDLKKLLFIAANFDQTTFTNTDLSDSNFRTASLVNASFNGLKLQRTEFIEAKMNESIWQNTTLSSVDMTAADLSKANFENVRFEECVLNDVIAQAASFKNCQFVDTLFFDADLSQCQFIDCQFENSDIQKGSTEGMTLS